MNDLNPEDLIANGKPCNIAEEVRRQVEVKNLLGTYSVDYVVENFDYVAEKYGYTRKQLEQMAPSCVKARRQEIERESGIAELMPKIFGAEGDS